MARQSPVLNTFTTCMLPCVVSNYTICFSIDFVIPGQVTKLKNQQFSGDFFFLIMRFCSEGRVCQEVGICGGEMTRLVFHPHVSIQRSRIDGLELSPILRADAT